MCDTQRVSVADLKLLFSSKKQQRPDYMADRQRIPSTKANKPFQSRSIHQTGKQTHCSRSNLLLKTGQHCIDGPNNAPQTTQQKSSRSYNKSNKRQILSKSDTQMEEESNEHNDDSLVANTVRHAMSKQPELGAPKSIIPVQEEPAAEWRDLKRQLHVLAEQLEHHKREKISMTNQINQLQQQMKEIDGLRKEMADQRAQVEALITIKNELVTKNGWQEETNKSGTFLTITTNDLEEKEDIGQGDTYEEDFMDKLEHTWNHSQEEMNSLHHDQAKLLDKLGKFSFHACNSAETLLESICEMNRADPASSHKVSTMKARHEKVMLRVATRFEDLPDTCPNSTDADNNWETNQKVISNGVKMVFGQEELSVQSTTGTFGEEDSYSTVDPQSSEDNGESLRAEDVLRLMSFSV